MSKWGVIEVEMYVKEVHPFKTILEANTALERMKKKNPHKEFRITPILQPSESPTHQPRERIS